METTRERGSALVETAVAVAIAGIVAGAVLGAAGTVLHSSRARTQREALQSEVRREMPVALDVLKYQPGGVAPISVATTLPMPTGTPLAAKVSIAVSPLPGGGLRVSIAASAIGKTAENVTLTSTLDERAPLPGARVRAPGLAPAPTGAP